MPLHALPEPLTGTRTLFVSPHLDDAVFACGRLLASAPGAVVATVFAGRPPASSGLTEWDRAAGFRPGDDVVGRRREEDRQALAGLGAWPLWLDFRDSQYGAAPSAEAVAEQLRRVCLQCEPQSVFFPLGLFHSDHFLTHAAALLLLGHCSGCRWFAYEDALYRRLPGLCEDRIAALRRAGYVLQRVRFAETPDAAAQKAAAVACYRSQLQALASPGRPGAADLDEAECCWRIRRTA